jgi:ATP-binding cassette subfamily B (MDR/TAP) protein 1
VLRNFNLKIEPGELVAIVGASGCGKTTVAGLIQRLWEPSEGEIWIGEGKKRVLQDVDVKWLRDKLAVVSQAPTLFDTSVAENIRYGSLPSAPPPSSLSTWPSTNVVSDTDIRTAAKQANIHQVIMGLGEGYDALLGANGGGLSGGQAQRVQIARAFARMVSRGDDDDDDDEHKGADLLILDEFTSALDGETEGAVLDAVRALVSSPSHSSSKRKPTVLMVTHKLEVMRLCDRIVVLDSGSVVEQGGFEELMGRKGEFARLASGGVWEF